MPNRTKLRATLSSIGATGWIPCVALSLTFPYVLLFIHNPFTYLQQSASEWRDAIIGALNGPNFLFLLLLLVRYGRLVINTYAYLFVYGADQIPANPTYNGDNVHVVISTIDPTNNAFETAVKSILDNYPRALTIAAGGEQHLGPAWEALERLREHWGHTGLSVITLPGRQGNKRKQLRMLLDRLAEDYRANEDVILVLVDDHAWWGNHEFLSYLLAPFEDPMVGLVGTKKQVFRNRGESLIESFVNFLACIYLERHNFELTAQNAIDGGAFVISARTCAIRARIVLEHKFREGFTNEMFFFGKYGPLVPDDDNYITRYVVEHGWKTKFQNHHHAIMHTTLGERPGDGNSAVGKFRGQILRWARSQWRSNPRSLCKRIVWKQFWVWSAPAVFLATCFNLALLWDSLIVYAWSRSSYSNFTAVHLAALIFGSKMIKLVEFFWRNPRDLVFFPGYIVFAYVHTFLKLWALLTFSNGAWSGRTAAVIETQPVISDDCGNDGNCQDQNRVEDRNMHASTAKHVPPTHSQTYAEDVFCDPSSGPNHRPAFSLNRPDLRRAVPGPPKSTPGSPASTTSSRPYSTSCGSLNAPPAPVSSNFRRSPRLISRLEHNGRIFMAKGPSSNRSSSNSPYYHTPWGGVSTPNPQIVAANAREGTNTFHVPSSHGIEFSSSSASTQTPRNNLLPSHPTYPKDSFRTPPQTPQPFESGLVQQPAHLSSEPARWSQPDKPSLTLRTNPTSSLPPMPEPKCETIVFKKKTGHSRQPVFVVDVNGCPVLADRERRRGSDPVPYARSFVRGEDCHRMHGGGTHLTALRYFSGRSGKGRRCRSPEPRYPVVPGRRL